jgi:hypothetical protein
VIQFFHPFIFQIFFAVELKNRNFFFLQINNWKDEEAAQFIKKYAPKWSEDLALRVYTSRLIGQNSVYPFLDKKKILVIQISIKNWFSHRLVLHGGGNTSVKLKVKNKVGEEIDVIAVKGSGWDLSNIGTK